MKALTFPIEITKEEAQRLPMKTRNAGLHLKEATVIYSFYSLAARLPELADMSRNAG